MDTLHMQKDTEVRSTTHHHLHLGPDGHSPHAERQRCDPLPTITFILDQMDTLHMQKDTEVRSTTHHHLHPGPDGHPPHAERHRGEIHYPPSPSSWTRWTPSTCRMTELWLSTDVSVDKKNHYSDWTILCTSINGLFSGWGWLDYHKEFSRAEVTWLMFHK